MLEEEKKEQKNMMLAMVLVILVLVGFNYVRKTPSEVSVVSEETAVTEMVTTEPVNVADKQNTVEQPRYETVVLPLSNQRVKGDFTTAGTIQNWNLITYRETTEEDSPFISLLNKNYQADITWNGVDMTQEPTIQGKELTSETPIVLTWDNDAVRLERTIYLDQDYLMTIEDTLINKTAAATTYTLNGQVVRRADTVPDSRSTVHEGFLGLFDNTEKEERYGSIEENKPFVVDNQGGWIGQTDKYWQTILVPEQDETVRMTFEKKGEQYIASFSEAVTIGAGQTVKRTTKLFAGAKELDLINAYEDQGIPRFDLSIDFGWYYFLTKPFLYFLGWLYSLVGNMGIAILIFATLIRTALLPIATKSYESMAKMKKIQPKIKALQERYKDNRQQLQIEMMNLYKRDKVNPASGCLPMLIQIPVFFALYKVLSVSILMRQAPFFGWIRDLSQRDPSSIFTAFGLLPWPIPSILDIGVLAVLMGLTMVIQQRLNPSTVTNEDQKIIMNMMPVIFTFMMGNFAAGLVIYWTWSNILSIAQQRYIMKKVGV